MKEKIIEIQGVKNYLGGHWVHDGVDLTINRGEIVAIAGGSGSGKTTLLRSILMLLRPTEGRIRVFGTDVIGLGRFKADKVRRRCGVTFQRNALFSSLTLLENVMFPLAEFSKLLKPLQVSIAQLKIVMAGLSLDAASKYPAELSGGMQKRAAVARAIALDPELLFLDEPTAGLDPHSAGAFDELVLHLRDALGLTVVMITHDLDTLWRVTDRVAFLGEGKVLACAPMVDLVKMEHPVIKAYFSGPRGQRAGCQ